MQIKLPHTLGQAQAVAHVKKMLDEGRSQAASHQATINEERWDGNVLNFDVSVQGQRISGTVTVTDTDYDIYAKLPIMLRMFEGRIEKAIKEQATHMLGGV